MLLTAAILAQFSKLACVAASVISFCLNIHGTKVNIALPQSVQHPLEVPMAPNYTPAFYPGYKDAQTNPGWPGDDGKSMALINNMYSPIPQMGRPYGGPEVQTAFGHGNVYKPPIQSAYHGCYVDTTPYAPPPARGYYKPHIVSRQLVHSPGPWH